jgi:hypothetical protein
MPTEAAIVAYQLLKTGTLVTFRVLEEEDHTHASDPGRKQPQRRLGGIAGHVPAE